MVKALVGSLSCTFGENMIGEKIDSINQYISDSLHNKFGQLREVDEWNKRKTRGGREGGWREEK